MKFNYKYLSLFILLGVAISLAGCFTGNVYTTVASDGTIANYKVVIETSSTVYSLLKESAKQGGFSSVREMFEKQGLGSQGIKFNYNEKWTEGNVIITMEAAESFSADRLKDVIITKEGQFLIYRQKIGDTSSQTDTSDNPFTGMMSGAISLNYYLQMPGKIVDSNANVVEGNKAEWHFSGTELSGSEIYAKSEIPSFPIPGFTISLGILSLIFSSLLLIKSKNIHKVG